jgi:hypothetical protein
MTITGNVLELDLDPVVHSAMILRTMPLWAWSSLFIGWTTPDMLLHHYHDLGHPVMLDPGAPITGCTMRYLGLHNCRLGV